MLKEIYLASSNPGKIEIFRYLCNNVGIRLNTFDNKINVIEDGLTAKENAIKKVIVYKNLTNLPIIADDSGLRFLSLNDEPGIKARRWNGFFSDDVDDETWLNYALNRLKNSNPPYLAVYDIAWAIYYNGKIFTKEFSKSYDIVLKPKLPYLKGLPMGSIEIDKNTGKYISELSFEERYLYLVEYFKDFLKEISF